MQTSTKSYKRRLCLDCRYINYVHIWANVCFRSLRNFASFFKFLNVGLLPIIGFIDLDLTLNLIGFDHNLDVLVFLIGRLSQRKSHSRLNRKWNDKTRYQFWNVIYKSTHFILPIWAPAILILTTWVHI